MASTWPVAADDVDIADEWNLDDEWDLADDWNALGIQAVICWVSMSMAEMLQSLDPLYSVLLLEL